MGKATSILIHNRRKRVKVHSAVIPTLQKKNRYLRKIRTCKVKLSSGRQCARAFNSTCALSRHKVLRHESEVTPSIVCKTTYSIHSYAKFRKTQKLYLDPTVLGHEEGNEDMEILEAIYENFKKFSSIPKPYYGCYILLIPEKFYDAKNTILQIIKDNFHKEDFELLIFVDTSYTPGPCPYHWAPWLSTSSSVRLLATSGYVAYTNDIVFCNGKSSQENKDAALHFQLKWKITSIVRQGFDPGWLDKQKVTFLNKTLSSKGYRGFLSKEEFRSAVREACNDDVPSVILDTQDGDWVHFPLLQMIKTDAKKNGATLPKEEIDSEFELQLDKDTGNFPVFQQKDALKFLSFWNKNIMTYQPLDRKLCFQWTPLIVLALLNASKDFMSTTQMFDFIKTNFPSLAADKLDHAMQKNAKLLYSNLNDSPLFEKIEKPGGHIPSLWRLSEENKNSAKTKLWIWVCKFRQILVEEVGGEETLNYMIKGELHQKKATLQTEHKVLQNAQKELKYVLPFQCLMSMAFLNIQKDKLFAPDITQFIRETFPDKEQNRTHSLAGNINKLATNSKWFGYENVNVPNLWPHKKNGYSKTVKKKMIFIIPQHRKELEQICKQWQTTYAEDLIRILGGEARFNQMVNGSLRTDDTTKIAPRLPTAKGPRKNCANDNLFVLNSSNIVNNVAMHGNNHTHVSPNVDVPCSSSDEPTHEPSPRSWKNERGQIHRNIY